MFGELLFDHVLGYFESLFHAVVTYQDGALFAVVNFYDIRKLVIKLQALTAHKWYWVLLNLPWDIMQLFTIFNVVFLFNMHLDLFAVA